MKLQGRTSAIYPNRKHTDAIVDDGSPEKEKRKKIVPVLFMFIKLPTPKLFGIFCLCLNIEIAAKYVHY